MTAADGPDPGVVLRALQGPAARAALAEVLAPDRVRSSTCLAVHRHGAAGTSARHACVVEREDGPDRRVQVVLHHSTRTVPDGRTRQVEVDGLRLHAWRFPHDPYLPGLAPAMEPTTARAVLDVADPTLVRHRYRPTRRALLAWGDGDGTTFGWVKVVGARTPAGVARRTSTITSAHAALRDAVPLPPVQHVDEAAGTVWLAHLPGATLRSLLRTGAAAPAPEAVLDVLGALHALPPTATGADPRGHADVTRHVRTLASLLPDLGPELERLGAVAADVRGPLAMVHGDLHDGQLLVEDGAVTGVLDVDGAGPGLVAQDLGRLVANCEAATLRGGAAAARAADYVEGLAAAAARVVAVEDLARAACGAWIALATGPHRVQTATWETDTRQRLEQARRWAATIG